MAKNYLRKGWRKCVAQVSYPKPSRMTSTGKCMARWSTISMPRTTKEPPSNRLFGTWLRKVPALQNVFNNGEGFWRYLAWQTIWASCFQARLSSESVFIQSHLYDYIMITIKLPIIWFSKNLFILQNALCHVPNLRRFYLCKLSLLRSEHDRSPKRPNVILTIGHGAFEKYAP